MYTIHLNIMWIYRDWSEDWFYIVLYKYNLIVESSSWKNKLIKWWNIHSVRINVFCLWCKKWSNTFIGKFHPHLLVIIQNYWWHMWWSKIKSHTVSYKYTIVLLKCYYIVQIWEKWDYTWDTVLNVNIKWF